MHKFILKIFELLWNFIQFLQILTMFCIVILLLFWIQNLTGENWAWLAFMVPLLNLIIEVAKHISDNSVPLFGTTFEFKYLIAVILLGAVYYILFLAKSTLSLCKEVYSNSRRQVKKINEKVFNAGLEHSVNKMQKKNDRYQIYVTTEVKKDMLGNIADINISEENKKMNKFLIEKTGVIPSVVRNGFVYSFSNFEQIDIVLEKFFMLLHSQTQLNYYICVYLPDSNTGKSQYNLEKLADLGIKNQIITLSDLVLRYNYNGTNNYDISVAGVFQKGDESFEVHRFVEKNNT